MQRLIYDEKLFLASYKKIAGHEYCPKKGKGHRTADSHSAAQQTGFFLSEAMLLTDYCFSWNTDGPVSGKFEDLFSSLDKKDEEIKAFCSSGQVDELHDLLSECLEKKLNTITDAISGFISGSVREEDETNDLELLGSMLYIAIIVIPGGDYESVSKGLAGRRPSFSDEERTQKAWRCLKETDLLKA